MHEGALLLPGVTSGDVGGSGAGLVPAACSGRRLTCAMAGGQQSVPRSQGVPKASPDPSVGLFPPSLARFPPALHPVLQVSIPQGLGKNPQPGAALCSPLCPIPEPYAKGFWQGTPEPQFGLQEWVLSSVLSGTAVHPMASQGTATAQAPGTGGSTRGTWDRGNGMWGVGRETWNRHGNGDRECGTQDMGDRTWKIREGGDALLIS